MFGFVQSYNRLLRNLFGISIELKSSVFREAFLTFCLWIDEADMVFQCKLCGVFPSIFCCDGIMVGIAKKNAKYLTEESKSRQIAQSLVVPLKERVYISKAKVSDLFR